jgi:sporulation protein YlmC with PRC-barrel domain
MKYAFATTSVAALLLAGPVLAETPAANSSDPAANGPEIVVKQPPPVITVQPHAPNVTVTPGKPDVAVQQAPPKVDVMNPTPNVAVDTGKPDVKVLPAEKPNVTVSQATNKPDVNVGTTAAPDARPPGTDAVVVAPTAGTFPVAKDVDKLIGKDVYGADGKEIGELNNFLLDPDSRVRAGVIEFGGFLGIGEHKVAVPWNDIKLQGDRLTVNLTKDQIKAMPRWQKDRAAGEFAEYKLYR